MNELNLIIGFCDWFNINQKALAWYYEGPITGIYNTLEDFAVEVYFEFDILPTNP